MRLLSSADWADFFESVSLVHEALLRGTRVAEMDFATRDRYRHAVEELARGSSPRRARGGTARRARWRRKRRQAADAARGRARPDPRRSDPGYYLISKGRDRLERSSSYRLPAAAMAAARLVLAQRLRLYLVDDRARRPPAVLAVPLVSDRAGRRFDARALVLLALLGSVPASDLAIALINRDVTRLRGPAASPEARARRRRAGRAAHAGRRFRCC